MILEPIPKGNRMHVLLRLQLHLLALVAPFVHHLQSRLRRDEQGQATAEYALVLVAAVAIAGLVVTWAKKTNLLDTVLDSVFRSLLQGG